MAGPLIIVGLTARAAARSAERAGYEPWCVDTRADRDLRQFATVRHCPPDEYPNGILRLMEDAPAEAPLLLTADMENHHKLVTALAFEHPLLGPKPGSIRRARQPQTLTTIPTTRGLRLCTVRMTSSVTHRISRMLFGVWSKRRYVLKPVHGSGGRGIRWWTPADGIGQGEYLQQYVPGTSYSCVYHADGWSAGMLGVTEQLVGDEHFGAEPFAYCGSIGVTRLSSRARGALAHLGVALTQRNDMRGVFGVDFVMDHEGRLWPVEVNPRYTDSVEIVERCLNVAALTSQRAPSVTRPRQVGKAIVRATQRARVGDLYAVFEKDQIADVPDEGAEIDTGQMICSVYATAPTRDACYEQLRERAAKVIEQGTEPA